MSAAGSSVFAVLSADSVNLDEESSQTEEAYDRVVKKVVEWGSEFLAVSDLAFYYVDASGGRAKYIMRDRLLDLLSDERVSRAPLARRLLGELRGAGLEAKVYVAASLTSPGLPRVLFESLESPLGFDGLARVLYELAREAGVLQTVECKRLGNQEEFQSVFSMFYGSYLKALELVGLGYEFGEHGGEPCVLVAGSLGVVLPPP